MNDNMQDDFSPHFLAPSTEAFLKLFHVFDDLSQTPYRRGRGIEAGDKHVDHVSYWHRITAAALGKHLDWTQREPTSFISLFADEEAAQREAQRRVANPMVYDQEDKVWWHRGLVQIAVVSAFELSRRDVFYFSTEDLQSDRMLWVGCQASLVGRLGRKEWFVMDWIPDEAVVQIIYFD
ncbi:MAG: hypothetical protein M1817_000445 [Caeruleum heppii]|nr:MAG: hypothetical protein M1817_000445 [Caeruleum heppii]